MSLVEGRQREIVWPGVEFSFATIPDTDRDVIFLLGTEPQLRWRTFCNEVVEVAQTCDVNLALTLGALLADVSHAMPTSVMGTAYDPKVVAELGLTQSRYEGPTGIVGVLHDAFSRAELRSASFWAAVPSYVPGAPSPKAQLALIERASQLLQVGVTTLDLQIASASYERQISELVESDEDTAAYVRALEESGDEHIEDPDPVEFVAEVEQFLRDHHDD